MSSPPSTGVARLGAALFAEGTPIVFGCPGTVALRIASGLDGTSARAVLLRDPYGATLAAVGYARATGRVGVCGSNRFEGATRLVAGLADAHLDGVPVVALVDRSADDDSADAVDVVSMSSAIVKKCIDIERASDLPRALKEAFETARSGRPGPVLVELPASFAVSPSDADADADSATARAPETELPEGIEAARALILAARRPVVCTGSGVSSPADVAALKTFVETGGVPTVAVLKGLGTLPSNHDYFLGLVGEFGARASDRAVQGADLLIAVGDCHDTRGGLAALRVPADAKILRLGVDGVGSDGREPDVRVRGDAAVALRALTSGLNIAEWRSTCLFERAVTGWRYDSPARGVYAPRLLKTLSEACEGPTFVACDSGSHQVWVAQHWQHLRPEQLLQGTRSGASGFGLPAAIGAWLGRPDARVVNVAGDGSFLANLHELATLRYYDIPVKMLVLDDHGLGHRRPPWEDPAGEAGEPSARWEGPDFVRLAACFGIPAMQASRATQEAEVVSRLLDAPGPFLAHVLIDRADHVAAPPPPAGT
ncbi:MAG: thiamine pyrophosphate-dependent enzyme [Myxococcota bacterium]